MRMFVSCEKQNFMMLFVLQIQIFCRPPVVLVLGDRKFVVANECTQHIMPERLMLIAVAVMYLECFEILTENTLGTWQETGTVLYLLEVGYIIVIAYLADVH